MSVVVLHTTESTASVNDIADYMRRRNIMSHEVYDPLLDQTVSLIPFGKPARSLVNKRGGEETNNRETDGRPGADVYQIEIVGFAKDVPTYDPVWHQRLADHIAAVCYLTGTPLELPPFLPYPRSYGANGVRFSFQEWRTFNGVCGHQHVPENTHGDPGDISQTIAILRQPLEVFVSAPIAYIDSQEVVGDEIHVQGWAYDPDRPSESIRVDVHVWEGGALAVHVATADVWREDVNAAKGISGAHGFDFYVLAPRVARHVEVVAYAFGTDNTPTEFSRFQATVEK